MIITAPPANLDQWRGHEVYSVWAAACLWVGEQPHPRISPKSAAYPALQLLKGAIAAGTLPIVEGDGSMKSRVRRADLVAFAERIGEQPAFLATAE